MVDIIIPTHNQESFTIKCLQSIRKYTTQYRIIWVDNGSTEQSRRLIMEELIKHKYLTIWNATNLGFIKAVNSGIKASKNEYLVLLNNDTEVTNGWLQRLLIPFRDTRVRLSGPISNAIGSWQGWINVKNRLYPEMPNLDGLISNQITDVLKKQFGDIYRDAGMLAFFCTLFKREIFDQIGLLDESYGLGLGDDDDYCQRVIQAGYRVVFVPSAFVYHNHRTTFKTLFSDEELKEMQKKNIELFRTRWNPITQNNIIPQKSVVKNKFVSTVQRIQKGKL